MRRLGASLRRAAPKGHETFISRTAPHQEPVPTSGPPCVQDTLRHAQTITIPAEARRALRLDLPGAQVEVILRDHDLVLLPHVAVPLERVRADGTAPGSGGG
jgi:hypothetical protein